MSSREGRLAFPQCPVGVRQQREGTRELLGEDGQRRAGLSPAEGGEGTGPSLCRAHSLWAGHGENIPFHEPI